MTQFDACVIAFTELSTDARTLNLARTLARNGKSVCIIALGTKDEVELYSKEEITFFPIAKSTLKKAWRRILNFQFLARPFDIVAKNYFAEDLYSLNIAIRLAKRHKGKVIYDSREIFSALGPLYKNPLKQKILSFIEKHLARKVNKFVVSGKLDGDYLKKHFRTEAPFHLVMNLPPFKASVKSNLLREKFKIAGDKIIIIYQGMLLPGRGLMPLLNALPFIEQAVMCLFGEGDYKQILESEAKKLNVQDRVIFCGKVNYDDLHYYTCAADIGWVFIEPISFSYNLALPNKLFEYCMANIPSIVSDLPAMRNVVGNYGIGKIISPLAGPQELAEAIKEVYGNKEMYIRNCESASKTLCYEAQENVILSIID